VDSPLVASYGHQDVLLPLDDYVDKKDWEDFLEQDRQIATYGGRILTLPWSSSSQAVFYNLDMLKEAGITPPSAPDNRWTWAQLLEAAQKLTKKAPDGTTQIYGFVVEQVDRPYQILPLLQSNGAQALSPDGSQTAGFLNSPEAVEALQFYGDPMNPPDVDTSAAASQCRPGRVALHHQPPGIHQSLGAPISITFRGDCPLH
jgi:fructooligosaccharide transport system substrate-binding protein